MFCLGMPRAEVIECCIRIILACLLGGTVGLERSHRFKEAGIRTHLIVCATAALFMIISKYAFGDIHDGTKAADSARIAAQVVSGISFLCAGVIFRIGINIKGLTTAAGLWMTAAIGMLCGAGLYTISVFAVIAIMIFQMLLHRFPIGNDSVVNYYVVIELKNGYSFDAFLPCIKEIVGGKGNIETEGVRKVTDGIEYTFNIRSPHTVLESEWEELLNEHEEIAQFKVSILN